MLTLGQHWHSDNEEVMGLSNLNTPAHISAAVATKLEVTVIIFLFRLSSFSLTK